MKRAALLVVAVLLTAPAARAALEPWGTSARAAGMADAFVAVADDLGALQHNPAGLGESSRPAFSADHSSLLAGLPGADAVSDGGLAAAFPMSHGAGTLAVAARHFHGSRFLNDDTLRLGYGLALPGADSDHRTSIGLAVTRLARRFGGSAFASNAIDGSGQATGLSDPALSAGRTAHAWSLDAGFLCRFEAGGINSLGLEVVNLNRPDLSLGGAADRAPRVIRAGLARRMGRGVGSVELRHRSAGSVGDGTEAAVGGERWANAGAGRLALRGGFVQGVSDRRAVSGGASAAWGAVRLDYAFELPLGAFADAGLSHHVTLSWELGGGTPGWSGVSVQSGDAAR